MKPFAHLVIVSCAFAFAMRPECAGARQASPLHVLKIAAGPAGALTNDTFTLNEERSVFNRLEDREVIVLFQWEGTAGRHTLVAEWRSPDGATTSNSTVNYTAKDRRFGVYWRLPVSPAMATGTWAIEATVDGQPAGRFTFEVTDAAVDPASTKRSLTHASLFDALGRMFVVIERSAENSRKLESVSGVLGPHGRIYTTMGAIDGADRLRGIMPDGSARELRNVLAWNRRQDWAVIDGSAAGPGELKLAAPESVRIGERYFSIEGDAVTGRILTELTITGRRPLGDPQLTGWIASVMTDFPTPGAPVVNEYGEAIGIIGTAVPGATHTAAMMRLRAELKGAPIVPIGLINVPEPAVATPIAELRRRGDLIPALAREQNVLSGGFAHEIARTNTVSPLDQRDEFSAQEKKAVAFVSWSPTERVKGLTKLQLFDSDNRMVLESKPKKINVGKTDLSLSSWEIPIASLSGTYRADVTLDDKPIWRGFVKITP